ncbi:unnamed protein product (macronuclear) [Paramecium tetraurelia]|uniref:Uncharacterized protein n=1 Tax=Paramecium tetraurelia TaxID=5888 RepID=A0BZL7_PARTE|nr:uncharacterized protein GSPATT00005836001 [Paramecium tetraurelia]CAK63984.1 unnamed protein product [Paramecium tetraurelia]|eukprot:XP_001431382.1 hypothetical protein (macronuclear) [Paramecium tetraurelia strain d4-2]
MLYDLDLFQWVNNRSKNQYINCCHYTYVLIHKKNIRKKITQFPKYTSQTTILILYLNIQTTFRYTRRMTKYNQCNNYDIMNNFKSLFQTQFAQFKAMLLLLPHNNEKNKKHILQSKQTQGKMCKEQPILQLDQLLAHKNKQQFKELIEALTRKPLQSVHSIADYNYYKVAKLNNIQIAS